MHTNASLAPEAIDSRRRYLCRHIFTDGHRCASPALRGNDFCYYHRAARPSVPLSGRTGLFTMPRIDDRAAVQIALYEILSRITAGDLDLRRAGSILYGLQIASTNLPPSPPARTSPSAQPPLVEEITRDRYLGDLAPILELPPAELPSAADAIAPALPSTELALAKPDIAPAIAPALPRADSALPDEPVTTVNAEQPTSADAISPTQDAAPVRIPPSCYAGSTEIIPSHAAEHARSAHEIRSAVHSAVQSAIHRNRPAIDSAIEPETPPSLPPSASPP